MIEIDNDAQRQPGWYQSKIGNVGASMISAVMAKGSGATRNNYMSTLLLERLTNVRVETYQSKAMEWGIETEAKAREHYGFMTNTQPTLAKYVPHPTVPNTGASPDSYIGEDGLLEIKCPQRSQHLDTLL